MIFNLKYTGKLHRNDRQYIGGLWQIPAMRLIPGNGVAWKEKGKVNKGEDGS